MGRLTKGKQSFPLRWSGRADSPHLGIVSSVSTLPCSLSFASEAVEMREMRTWGVKSLALLLLSFLEHPCL